MQAGKVWLFVDEMAANDSDDLIDPVAELVAAILDMHSRLPMRQVLAGDVGDAGHRRLSLPLRPSGRRGASLHSRGHVPTLSGRSLPNTPSDFSFRCSAERSMPTKAAVREMLPPKRVT